MPRDMALVHEYIRGCSVCQRNKTKHLHPSGLLRPLDIPSSIWTDIAMDFMEGFPKVGGKCVILTIIDQMSKYAHFMLLGHTYSSTSIAKTFINQVVRLHGLPASIVSDRDQSSPVSSGVDQMSKHAHFMLCLSFAFQP
jgi:hypothetical protein